MVYFLKSSIFSTTVRYRTIVLYCKKTDKHFDAQAQIAMIVRYGTKRLKSTE